MPLLAQCESSNAGWSPTLRGTANGSYAPVYVVVGGTSGIGQGIAEALARHTTNNARIVLVGRNKSAAQQFIAGFPPSIAGEFAECDLRRVISVKRLCASLCARFPRIHMLVMTAGALTTTAEETPEGLEASMCISYYARWAFVDGLLPSLHAAQAAGQDARVFMSLNAGLGRNLDVGDLGMKRYLMNGGMSISGLMQAAGMLATYTDLMIMR
ncbi:KR domain-containing protein [Mycena kentingensis (nom. inval.)]|nr:KR domain-containing protein [Mycena kentingensis (nom. inval.)]